MSQQTASADRDPFLYDTEQLHALARQATVETGLRWFKENRVIDLGCDGETLWARVEDPEQDDPLSTDLAYDDAGNLSVTCGCGAEEEPVCAHALAVLYQYAAQQAGDRKSVV